MGVHYIIGRARIPMKVLKKLSPSYPQSARSVAVPTDSGSVPTNLATKISIISGSVPTNLATKIRRNRRFTPPPIFPCSLWPNTFSGPVPAGCNKITTDRWAFPLFSATYLSLPSPAHASSGEDMEICLRRQRKSLLVDELEEQRNHFGKAPLSHARLDTGISTAFSHVDDFIF